MTTQTPDEVTILTAERFLDIVRTSLRGVEYVAMNTSRSGILEIGGHTLFPVMAVGFEKGSAPYIAPLMSRLFGAEQFVLGAEDAESEPSVREALQELGPGSDLYDMAIVPEGTETLDLISSIFDDSSEPEA